MGNDLLIGKAKRLRRETLDLAIGHDNGHVASALSIVEILVALYHEILGEEDRFILSKGHGCLSLYAVLRQKGLDPTISGHPDMEPDQGIECTTGSLGHGLPIAMGMALAKKIRKENGNVYVLMGDGECQEGTTWESMLLCNKLVLDNLTVIVDCNGLQALGRIEDVLPLGDLRAKFHAFDAHVSRVDGHSIESIVDALRIGEASTTTGTPRPRVVLADTVKGKGISFIENRLEWHSRLPEGPQLEYAYRELE